MDLDLYLTIPQKNLATAYHSPVPATVFASARACKSVSSTPGQRQPCITTTCKGVKPPTIPISVMASNWVGSTWDRLHQVAMTFNGKCHLSTAKKIVIAIADHPKYTGTLVKHMNLSLHAFATSWNCHMPYVKICSRIIAASTLSFRYVRREKLNKIWLPKNWMILRTGMQPAKNTAHPITPGVDPHFAVQIPIFTFKKELEG